jgi:hypothetical protein
MSNGKDTEPSFTTAEVVTIVDAIGEVLDDVVPGRWITLSDVCTFLPT